MPVDMGDNSKTGGLTRRRWPVAQILLIPVPEEGWLAPFPVA